VSLDPKLRDAPTGQGLRTALVFALVAERLTVFYEHAQWLKEGQGATLAADWLARSGRSLPSAELRALSKASDKLAREIQANLSREAGLYTAHEMTESLDPNHRSDIGTAMMDECARRVDALGAGAD
jgi:hypothetical protein